MADAHKNFAYSTVATAPSPAASGTSLVVAAGDGAKFPAVPFNVTIWPVSTQPLTTNAEIVRVTAIATDTLTITRTQESTSARTIVVGDQIAATITAKTLTDVERDLVGFGFPFTVDPSAWNGNTGPVNTNNAHYARVMGGGTITKIGMQIVTSSGNISAATYSNTGTARAAMPLTRRQTTGTIACPAAGYAEVTLGASDAVAPGDWFGLSMDNATVAWRKMGNAYENNQLWAGRLATESPAHPCPSTATPVVGSGSNGVILIGVP